MMKYFSPKHMVVISVDIHGNTIIKKKKDNKYILAYKIYLLSDVEVFSQLCIGMNNYEIILPPFKTNIVILF